MEIASLLVQLAWVGAGGAVTVGAISFFLHAFAKSTEN